MMKLNENTGLKTAKLEKRAARFGDTLSSRNEPLTLQINMAVSFNVGYISINFDVLYDIADICI